MSEEDLRVRRPKKVRDVQVFPRREQPALLTDPQERELVRTVIKTGEIKRWAVDELAEARRVRRRLSWLAKVDGRRLKTAIIASEGKWVVVFQVRPEEES
jgi:hypothetical protein